MRQRTLSFMRTDRVKPFVPTTFELVDCLDSNEKHARIDCTEDANGDFWSDPENLGECNDCADVVGVDDLDDNDGLCSCCRENYIECYDCNDLTHRDNCLTSDCDDSYCRDCYYERYDHCECCECEISRDHSFFNERTEQTECEECYSRNAGADFDPDYCWSGRAEFDKMGSNRKFGVELETSDCPEYNDWAKSYYWGVKDDGSIRGKEFVSPPLRGNDGYDNVMEVCDRLNREGCEVDDDCGFHLHIDLSDTNADDRKKIALAYHYTSDVWHDFVEEQRRGTFYAQRHRYERKDILDSRHGPEYLGGGNRYIWVNWNAFTAHKTVEIRLHHATIDGCEVINWAKAHTKFIDFIMSLTAGQVTRIFGGKTNRQIRAELSFIWKDADLTGYYNRKAEVEYAA